MSNNKMSNRLFVVIRLVIIANALYISSSILPRYDFIYLNFESYDAIVVTVSWVTSLFALILLFVAAAKASPTPRISMSSVNDDPMDDGVGVGSPKSFEAPVAGIALACVLSVAAVVALAARSEQLLTSVSVWLLYIVTAGFVIDVKEKTPLRKVLAYCAVPSAILMIGSLALLALVWLTGGGAAVSGTIYFSPEKAAELERQVKNLILIYSIMCVLTMPAIAAACLARTRVVELYGASKSISAEDLEQLRTKINIVFAIIALVFGALLAL